MNGNIDPIEPTPTLRIRVYESLERLIIEGALAPGEHLVETELATRLGVSRGPVREALQTLSRDGWVELRPRHGAFVRQPSEREVDEFFQVRALLEGECARLAAANIDELSARDLRENVAAGWSAVRSGEEAGLVAANAHIHLAITELSGNATLQELTQRLRKRSQWFFTPVSMARAQDAWREHEAIVEAIVAGDALGAAQRMRAHVDGTRKSYASLILESDGQSQRAKTGAAPHR